MIQVEVIESSNEEDFVNDVNYFLEQLENHLFIDIKYSFSMINNDEKSQRYTALIIYKIE